MSRFEEILNTSCRAYIRPTSMYGDWVSGEKYDERDEEIYTRTRLLHRGNDLNLICQTTRVCWTW